LLQQVAPFVNPVADALDLADGAIEDVSEVRTIDATVKRGSAYVPTPQYALPDIAVAMPSAGEVVGPTGFLERLGWYRESRLASRPFGNAASRASCGRRRGLIAIESTGTVPCSSYAA
jgi:hypothetical protein